MAFIGIIGNNKDFNFKDDNNNSLVFKLTYKNNSMLFTGDIENSAEKFILENDLNLSADILKIAHHGSKTSTSEDFLKEVNPSVALISCKESKIYNHPDEQTINTLKNNNISIYGTYKNNAISINFYKNNFKIKCIQNDF